VFWRFYEESSLDHWIVTSDSDHAEGFSKCDLKIGHQGYGLFHGNLCSRVPKDGRIQNAGYCNMITKRVSVTFHILYLFLLFVNNKLLNAVHIQILFSEIFSTRQFFGLESLHTS